MEGEKEKGAAGDEGEERMAVELPLSHIPEPIFEHVRVRVQGDMAWRRCTYCQMLWQLPPFKDCQQCQKSKNPVHTRHAMCPKCWNVYQLLLKGERETALRMYGSISQDVERKAEAELVYLTRKRPTKKKEGSVRDGKSAE